MLTKRARMHCKTGTEPMPLRQGEITEIRKQEIPLTYYASNPELHTRGLNNIAARKLMLRALNYIRDSPRSW